MAGRDISCKPMYSYVVCICISAALASVNGVVIQLMHGLGGCRAFSRVLAATCWGACAGFSIINEWVTVDAKFKVQRPVPAASTRSLAVSATPRNIRGRSRGAAGLCTCKWLVESQLGRRLCEIISIFGSPDQAKRGEIFGFPLLPHPPPSALNSPPLAYQRSESK